MPTASLLAQPLQRLAVAGLLVAAQMSAPPALAAGEEDQSMALRETALRRLNLPQSMKPQGTATPEDRDRRLREGGFDAGDAIYIRIFKAESELEVWLKRDATYERFATYPICYWSGKLGPKLREGDRQAPEGFYNVGARQLYRHGRWPRSLDIGFPNAFDRANQRTGSAILIHGGCTSIGCYAMTNPVMDEVFSLVEKAMEAGQETIPIHVFPFRMTAKNLASQGNRPWIEFWHNLKVAYDSFERVRQPPHVAICGTRYLVRDGDEEAAAPIVPRRMLRLVRMMRGDWPVQPGECHEQAPAPSEVASATSPFAHALRGAELPATRVVTRHVQPAQARVYRNARFNYAAARKARMAAYARKYPYQNVRMR